MDLVRSRGWVEGFTRKDEENQTQESMLVFIPPRVRENLDVFPSLVHLLGRSLPGEKRPRCPRQLPLPPAEADPRIWREDFLRVTDRHCQGEGFAQCLSFGFTAFKENSRNPPSAASCQSSSPSSLSFFLEYGGWLPSVGPSVGASWAWRAPKTVCLWRLEIVPVGTGRELQAHPTLQRCDMTLQSPMWDPHNKVEKVAEHC